MSGQEVVDSSTSERMARIDKLVARIGRRERKKLRILAKADEEMQRIRERVASEADPLTAKNDRDLEELAGLVAEALTAGEVDGKSLAMRSGVISTRTVTYVEILDKALLRAKALRRRVWKLISVPKPREPQKTLLAKLFKARPETVKWFAGAARLVEVTRMTVKPHKVETELQRDLNPLRTTLSS